MSAHTTLFVATPPLAAPNTERRHWWRLVAASLAFIVLVLGIATYGWDYYMLGSADRPFSPKHHLLKPSGIVGINLGVLGALVFCTIFLYPLRKRWRWLQKQGSSKHWLDYHVILGLAAPCIIGLHSSFKFQGLAGVAFWIMVAVAISGFVGRYLYSQIPRRVGAAEMSMKESRDMQEKIWRRLESQTLISEQDLRPLFNLPTAEQVAESPLILSLGWMVALDIARPFHIARLRLRAMGPSITFFIFYLGGLARGRSPQLERVILLAREQASLSKRILFLSRAQKVFQMWHVIHRPFSYTFAVLALLHIAVAMLLGFI